MIENFGYTDIMMWLVTARSISTSSTDCAVSLGMKYGDVGHVTTLTNHIIAHFRTFAGNCAITS